MYLKDFSLKFIFISKIHVILHHPKLSSFLQQLNKYQLWFYQAADWTISESEICDFSNISFFWNLAKSNGWWSCVNISIHLSYQWFFSNHPRGISIEDVFFSIFMSISQPLQLDMLKYLLGSEKEKIAESFRMDLIFLLFLFLLIFYGILK